MKYHELTDPQKKLARDLWWELEEQDTQGAHEYDESLKAALAAHTRGITKEVAKRFLAAEVTGWYHDGYLHDVWEQRGAALTRWHIRAAYARGWEGELRGRRDRAYIEEAIEANEYDFGIEERIVML